MQEFSTKTIAVLRAELGDVERFARCEQVIAYAGLDVTEKREWEGAGTTQARPVEAVADSGGSCTWLRSDVFDWRSPPLAPIITGLSPEA